MEIVYTRSDVHSVVRNAIDYVSLIKNRVDTDVLTLSNDKIKTNTIIQTLTGKNFSLSSKERMILEIIISHSLTAERISPGSFKFTIDNIIKRLSDHKEVIFKKENDILAIKPTLEHIMNFIHSKVNDDNIRNILLDAIKLSGNGGKIVVEKSVNEIYSVELCRGYTFNSHPAWPVGIKFVNPRIIVIDGYVENVSEIHHILEISTQRKDKIVIFCRGMSNDVIHTLKINYDRGTLGVIPVIVNFDLEGINSINDISTVTGSELVSSNKGNLISTISYDKLPVVDAAILYPNKTIIQNSSTYKSVNNQINFLLNKRSETDVDDMHHLYDKRIKSLIPNQVIIRLPDNRNFIKVSQTIDYVLRMVKSMIEFGVHQNNDEYLPATCSVVSNFYARKCVDMINSVGAILQLSIFYCYNSL